MLEYIFIDNKALAQKPTVLLSIQKAQNLRLLKKQLGKHYTVVEDNNDPISNLDFDIFITDYQSFRQKRELFIERKESELPVFLPILLLAENENILKQDPHIWDLVDDLIQLPVPVKMLEARISNMMRTRKYSKRIARKNEKLRLFEQAIESTNVGIIISKAKEKDNPIVFSNKGFEKLTGYKKQEIMGKDCRFLQNHDRDQREIQKIREALSSGEECKATLRNYKKDGTLFWNELSIAPIKNQNGEISHFVGIQEDITQRKKNEQQLQESLEEKKILLQEIHHRVKNNLAVISGLLQVQQFENKDENIDKILGNSITRIKSMALIHEKLYQSESLSKLNFSNYIEDLVTSITKTIQINKQIDISLDCNPITINVNQAVPCALILNEIISNAMEHAFPNRETGEVSVSFKEKENKICVTISDNGIGLPDSLIEKSSSMGLTIIQTLITQLEADLNIDNKEGTSFNFVFEKQDLKGAYSRLV